MKLITPSSSVLLAVVSVIQVVQGFNFNISTPTQCNQLTVQWWGIRSLSPKAETMTDIINLIIGTEEQVHSISYSFPYVLFLIITYFPHRKESLVAFPS